MSCSFLCLHHASEKILNIPCIFNAVLFHDFPYGFVQYSVFLNFSKHNLYLLIHFLCYLWIAGIILAAIKQATIKRHSAACLVGQKYQSRTQRFPGWSKAPEKGSLKMDLCGCRTLGGWRENWGSRLSPGMPRWRRCETAFKKTSNRRAMWVLLLLSSYFSSTLLHKCSPQLAFLTYLFCFPNCILNVHTVYTVLGRFDVIHVCNMDLFQAHINILALTLTHKSRWFK